MKSGRSSDIPDEKSLYSQETAARMAHVSIEFLVQCEREELVEPRRKSSHEMGFNRSDVSRLARIRRLHDDLDLEFPAIDIVLRMRRQMLDLLNQLDDMELAMAEREEELFAEIQALRQRVAEDVE
ncbi:MAG: chaperone modulator CbpM [Anaerolineales bacterium]